MKLLQLQRRMAAAVMQPLTMRGRITCTTPDGQPMRREAAAFIKPNARLTSIERLEIYSRSYWFRVLDSLADDFPGLRAVLGQTAFNRLARAYLTDCPSRSFTLRDLGERLAEWLKANPHYAGRAPALCLDMAKLEWAHIEAFDFDAEKALGPEDLVHLGSGFRAGLQPHIRLLELDHAVDEMRIHLKLRPALAGPIFLAVHRCNDTVYYRRLAAEEYLVLNAIRSGRPLGKAIAEGFRESSATLEDVQSKIGEWFATWAELGWLCASKVRKRRVSK
jgi:hypothetical protein